MSVPEENLSRDRAIYIISVAAELAGVHPQTLRIYERKGLLTPARTQGNTRRYSERDIEQLAKIQELTQEGVNLAGVVRILELENELDELRERFASVVDEFEALEERVREEAGLRERNSLVLRRDVRRVKRAMKADIVESWQASRSHPLPPIQL
ncbi:MAG: MerR family transcriptional regulator [Actinobacteria bacterium]|nr:MerR family transcriptional regulator [Actinomycetota bacterium]